MTALLLAGCSSIPSSMNPVTWWHDLQGGEIAKERPPPPGANQPYPNLASVPPKPAEPDRGALASIASALVADRTNAQHMAAVQPIPDPSSPSASPGLFGQGTLPPPPPPAPPGAKTATATLPAAEAPPAPASPPTPAAGPVPAPSKAPVGAVATAPLAPPATPPASAAASASPAPPAPAAAAQAPASATPAASAANVPLTPPGAAALPPSVPPAPPPPIPAKPPAPPSLPGVAAVTVPTPPPPLPATLSGNTVTVTFDNGSAKLPMGAADTLKQLAAKRGNGIIAVTGYGDAASHDPNVQSAALSLGLSRAQAMAAALTSAGVPASAVQVDSEAVGRGGTARVIQ